MARDFPGNQMVETSPSSAGGGGSIPGLGAGIPHALQPKDQGIKNRSRFDPWVGKIP